MKGVNSNLLPLLWGIAILGTVAVTVGIFLTFAPPAPDSSYWIAMGDLCLMEIVTGALLVYNFSMPKGSALKVPYAMNIAIETMIAIFFIISVVIDLLFLFLNSGTIFIWVVIIKWLILLFLIGSMWSAAQEDKEERVVLEQSREERIDVLNVVQQELAELRRLPTGTENGATQRQVIDELELLRNQLRSRTSERTTADNGNLHLRELLDDLVKDINVLRNSPEGDRKTIFTRIQDDTRRLSREVRYPSMVNKN